MVHLFADNLLLHGVVHSSNIDSHDLYRAIR